MERMYRELDPSLIVFFERVDPHVVRTSVESYTGHPTRTTRWDKAVKN